MRHFGRSSFLLHRFTYDHFRGCLLLAPRDPLQRLLHHFSLESFLFILNRFVQIVLSMHGAGLHAAFGLATRDLQNLSCGFAVDVAEILGVDGGQGYSVGIEVDLATAILRLFCLF